MMIPNLRKLLSDNVDPSLYGSVYAIPALIEVVGFALGGILFNSLFKKDPLNSSWLYYGVSMGIIAAIILSCILSYFVHRKFYTVKNRE